ncbi:hypothetical protein JRO89_XS06G0090200 [Xanthoceras sorbifolium]|uniref:Uncharacterized protein n=1 Tax=Xanthoceras sorbifolium TaxID=99658 RepID=A0ABQ8HXR9_9ROSI|nr:hypothetical protein JRO89_XS06G0090200 [Xanthoceras sorbifolium]
MVKEARSFDQRTKTWLRKGTWNPVEGQKLIAYINRYGIWNWTQMPKAAGCYIYNIIKLHLYLCSIYIITTTVTTYQNNPYEVYDDVSLSNASQTSNLDYCNNNIATPMPSSSQLSTDTFSSSTSSDPAREIYKSQTIEDNYNNGSSSETLFGEFQNFWEQPFPMDPEGLYTVDDCGTTYTDPGSMESTSQWGFQENTYAFASYCDDGDDLCIFGPIF